MPFPQTNTKVALVRPGQGGAGSLRQEPYPVAAGSIIFKGDIVTLSLGAVAQALGLPAVGAAITSTGGAALLGRAMADFKADANGVDATHGMPRTTLEVAVFDDNLEIGLRIYNGTVADTEPRDVTVGTAYNIARVRTATDNWHYAVSSGAPTNGELEITAKHPGSAADDDYGVVWCRCVDASKQIGG